MKEKSKHHVARKMPRQQRSRNMVETIKQAALLLLTEEGLSGCGTDRIAERAGISIGSLYQYFPNREAILTVLYEDISAKNVEILKSRMPRFIEMPAETGVTKAMELLLDMFDRNQLVLLQLAIELPHLRLSHDVLSFTLLVRSVARAYLISTLPASKAADLDRMVFFHQQIILGCISGYLREAPPGLTRKSFIRDLTRVVIAYIESCQYPKRKDAGGSTARPS